MDLLDWNSLIDSRTKISKLLLVPNMQVGTHLCYPQSGPTGRALGFWGSGVWVRCPQAQSHSSLVAAVLAGIGAARARPCRDPPWAGWLYWPVGAGELGWAAALGMGFPPPRECFCLPWARLATDRVPQAVVVSDWAAGASALTLH